MKTSVSKDLFASVKMIASRFLVVVAMLSLSSCLNDEFRTGNDIVDGEDMEVVPCKGVDGARPCS